MDLPGGMSVASEEAKRVGQGQGRPAYRIRERRGAAGGTQIGVVYPYPTGARTHLPTPKDVSSVLRNAVEGVLRLAGPDARRSATVRDAGPSARGAVQRANLCKAVRVSKVRP